MHRHLDALSMQRRLDVLSAGWRSVGDWSRHRRHGRRGSYAPEPAWALGRAPGQLPLGVNQSRAAPTLPLTLPLALPPPLPPTLPRCGRCGRAAASPPLRGPTPRLRKAALERWRPGERERMSPPGRSGGGCGAQTAWLRSSSNEGAGREWRLHGDAG